MLAFTKFFFLLFIPFLGDLDWETRELTHDFLQFCRPFSDSALVDGTWSENPEINFRAKTILKGGFSWTLDWEAYFIAQELIYTDYKKEFMGLPWIPDDIEQQFIENKRVRKAIIHIIHEKHPDWYIYDGDGFYLYGINDIRFDVRGLNYPSNLKFNYEEEAKRWEQIKKDKKEQKERKK